MVHLWRRALLSDLSQDTLSSMGDDIEIARTQGIDFPSRTFVVIPMSRLDPPRAVTRGIDPDFQSSTGLKDAGASGTGVAPTVALPGFHR
ncbi:MAG: hypothetical protein QOG23_2420 [Blastocatellia bacterium]|jgi:hypothetical protein|nr:hypothetical protein [Blastocatellia bacterium]